MKPHEEVRRDLLRQWLATASEDLGTARHLMSTGASYFNSVGFHSQQAAEKYLKALLFWMDVDFPKTHDIAVLVDRVASRNFFLSESLHEATILTDYGVEIRYPGELPGLTRQQAERAVGLAEKVQEEVLALLKDALTP